MRKYIFETALLIGLSLSLIVGALAKEEQSDISEKLIRLHIIANSDSAEDQTLKLQIRDKILVYMDTLTKECKTKEDARQIISQHLPEFEKIANSLCEATGVSYRATASLSESIFPTKEYGLFSLPAGRYEALKISLGTAEGKNWWCVLFPPLCVSAAEAESFSAEFSEEELRFITSDSPEYKLKFKLLELLKNL